MGWFWRRGSGANPGLRIGQPRRRKPEEEDKWSAISLRPHWKADMGQVSAWNLRSDCTPGQNLQPQRTRRFTKEFLSDPSCPWWLMTFWAGYLPFGLAVSTMPLPSR